MGSAIGQLDRRAVRLAKELERQIAQTPGRSHGMANDPPNLLLHRNTIASCSHPEQLQCFPIQSSDAQAAHLGTIHSSPLIAHDITPDSRHPAITTLVYPAGLPGS